ncbi:hypothetical protein ACFE04_021154 [Oxalis oulophora]
MEALDIDKAEKLESHLISAAAFVEGGVQDACDEACSICLDDFSESNPSAITNCRHEFHLQCILEWCQRSSQCPMCWQAISLKDPTSQELLDAVEMERSVRNSPSRNATIFHHPTIGNFEMQFPVGVTDAELEERIIQQLAAAASIGRSRHIGRRENQRSRASAHGRPHFLVFSSHPRTSPSSSLSHMAGDREVEPIPMDVPRPSAPLSFVGVDSPQRTPHSSLASGPAIVPASRRRVSFNNRSTGSPASPNEDGAGSSDLQSFSDSLKARLNSVSIRYKESIAKNTRGWKERLFSRSSSLSEMGSEVPREVTAAGIGSVSRLMEHLEVGENNQTSQGPRSIRSTNSVREAE